MSTQSTSSSAPAAGEAANLQKFRETETSLSFNLPVSNRQELVDILRELEHSRTIRDLEFRYEYDDVDPPMLDLDLDLDEFLPSVARLELYCCFLGNFNLRSSSLTSLSIEQISTYGIKTFSFRLPALRSLNFQFVLLDDPTDFGASVSASPRLDAISSYKLWGLGRDAGTMYLPSCTRINLYRSDDLRTLKMYCPRLDELDLQACYGISSVSFLKRY